MSPRTEKQLFQIREQSKARILEAALKLFAEQGYHKTSIAQIAKEAGVAKGLIYNYFQKKEDLMTGIIHHGMEASAGMIQQMEAIEDPKGKIKLLVDYGIDFMLEDAYHTRLMFGISLQLQDFPELEPMIRAKYESYTPLMVEFFKAAGIPNPESEALFMAATFDGLGIQYVVMNDTQLLEKARKAFYERYDLEGVEIPSFTAQTETDKS
ncbi:TetR/AcrR family transcriptional regulator [Pontibacter sp. G13]|uniref:TetR/AcrR family transcriptional regulator n=1 Tax=Pontibacter sp. G13 TaxID=3074898 RepID=UPI002889D6A1|nr:TetR/AcrR family transcriptional regulator [Pontibacter sp. G13]WNJ18600.1 TetR/AcrR family transcriptional regulator [Pontibacter sp. G13]